MPGKETRAFGGAPEVSASAWDRAWDGISEGSARLHGATLTGEWRLLRSTQPCSTRVFFTYAVAMTQHIVSACYTRVRLPNMAWHRIVRGGRCVKNDGITCWKRRAAHNKVGQLVEFIPANNWTLPSTRPADHQCSALWQIWYRNWSGCRDVPRC